MSFRIFLKCVSCWISFSLLWIWSWRFSFLGLKLFERIQKCEGSRKHLLRFKSFWYRTWSLGFYGIFNDSGCRFINNLLLLLNFVGDQFVWKWWFYVFNLLNSKISQRKLNLFTFYCLNWWLEWTFFICHLNRSSIVLLRHWSFKWNSFYPSWLFVFNNRRLNFLNNLRYLLLDYRVILSTQFFCHNRVINV